MAKAHQQGPTMAARLGRASPIGRRPLSSLEGKPRAGKQDLLEREAAMLEAASQLSASLAKSLPKAIADELLAQCTETDPYADCQLESQQVTDYHGEGTKGASFLPLLSTSAQLKRVRTAQYS